MNKKANTNYRVTSEKTKKLINARLNEKYKEQDFYKVIDTKCTSWLKDKEMCKYLRPETLFGTKFESYLNEKIENVITKQEVITQAEEEFLNDEQI